MTLYEADNEQGEAGFILKQIGENIVIMRCCTERMLNRGYWKKHFYMREFPILWWVG